MENYGAHKTHLACVKIWEDSPRMCQNLGGLTWDVQKIDKTHMWNHRKLKTHPKIWVAQVVNREVSPLRKTRKASVRHVRQA